MCALVAASESRLPHARVVAVVAFVSSSLAVSWSPPPPGPDTCTVRGGIRVDALAVVLVVRDVATDAAATSSVAAVVAVGGGSFKFDGEGSVMAAGDTDVRGALPGVCFLFPGVLRLTFARFRAMLLTGMLVGIAGKTYIIVRCWDAKLWEHGWLGATCGCRSNYVVQTQVILWHKPQNSVDPTVLSLWYIIVRGRCAHVGLCTPCKYIHIVLSRGTLSYKNAL
jgi:hypothetical protein